MKFLVLYNAPAAALEAWMAQPEEARKADEEKMKGEWDAWIKANGANLKETAGAGKTKRVTSAGVADVKNDVMMYSMVEGESAEAVANMFVGHPHFGIPGGWIDVMPANVLPGMEGM